MWWNWCPEVVRFAMHEAEKEWMACADPRPMLAFLQGKHLPRKLGLFACACCRRVEHMLTDQRSRQALETVERFHDGIVVHQAYAVAEKAATDAHAAHVRAVGDFENSTASSFALNARAVAHMFAAQAVLSCFGKLATDTAHSCSGALRGFGTANIEDDRRCRVVGDEIEAAERVAQCDMIRDIFGNPFQSVTVESNWLTPTVVPLASDIYDQQVFDRMPLLADTLQAAGCDNADILNHCRDPKVTHVRGCWVVDLLLGKT
jgi:hypothetical protein